MSSSISPTPIGVPTNEGAPPRDLLAPEPTGTVPAASPPAAPAPAQPPAAVEPAKAAEPPAATPPAAGEKPDGNLLKDALDKGGETTAGDDTKPAEPPEALKAEDYKFELPEGINAEDPLVAAFREGAAKSNLSPEAAQALVNELGPKIAEQLAANHKAWDAMQADWQKQTREHAEIGGDKLPETVSRVTGLLRQFGHPDLPNALAVSGLGNNPALIWTLNNIASRMMEGTAQQGGTPNTIATRPSEGARLLYTSTADAAGKEAVSQ